MRFKKYRLCLRCRKEFTEENVHSDSGWRETQISGLCEDCFDLITNFDDENDEYDECDDN